MHLHSYCHSQQREYYSTSELLPEYENGEMGSIPGSQGIFVLETHKEVVTVLSPEQHGTRVRI